MQTRQRPQRSFASPGEAAKVLSLVLAAYVLWPVLAMASLG